MSDLPEPSSRAEPRGGGATRPPSVWLEHMRHEQWERLVVHARICLCRYPEQVECAIRADDLVQTILTDAVEGRFDSAEVTWEKLLPFLEAVVDKRAWKVARGRRRRERRESRVELNPPPPPGEGLHFERRSAFGSGVISLAP